ncbi:MAG: ABC transporter permease [Candidatus Rokubacteria bacterium]|nr:ABC transporter permease [Candidatus Rokubacteria bacterium]
MLGIIIGVGAFIASGAIGAGAQQRIAEQIRSLGSNLVVILSGSLHSGGIRLGSGTQLSITEDDAAAVAREVPSVLVAAPVIRGAGQIVYGNQNWSTTVQGVTPDYEVAREWPAVAGKYFGPEDLDGATKVALVGQTVVENLFGGTDPIGQIIRIRNVPFTVTGVLDRKGQSSWGTDQDDIVLIPLSTAKKKVMGVSQANARAVSSISVKVRAGEDMRQAETDIRALLRQRHRLQPDQDDDFSTRNLEDLLATQERAARVMTNLLYAIAAVSLMVGGIGIMNIMLVSVTERTREIGLRMAIGARGKDILSQFLIEAVILSLIGGVVGVVVGVGSARAVSYLADWSTVIQAGAVPLAFAFASAVGVFFGFYPAWKASRLDPINALRYE